MTVKTMEDLFVETLKDIYYAEKHILKALPGMVKKAGRKNSRTPSKRTGRRPKDRSIGWSRSSSSSTSSPRGKKCEAIEGIIAEAKEHMEDIEDPEVLDAGMIGSAQAVEHYEITRYGTLIAWAKQLGRDEAIELLEAEPRGGEARRSAADRDRRVHGQPEGRRVKLNVATRSRPGGACASPGRGKQLDRCHGGVLHRRPPCDRSCRCPRRR